MSTGLTVLVSVLAAVLASGICAIVALSLASRRWTEMRAQVAQDMDALRGRLADVQSLQAKLEDRMATAQKNDVWGAGDKALREGLEAQINATSAEVRKQQSALNGLQQTLAGMQLEPEGATLSPHEMDLYQQLVHRMEPMVAAEVRAARSELEALFSELYPRRGRIRRRESRHEAEPG